MTKPPAKTSAKQGGRFPKGTSGNPRGRPQGSRHKTTLAVETLLDGQATALTQRAIDAALSGDMVALRLCLDRVAPPRRGRVVALPGFPRVAGLADVPTALSELLRAVASAELTADEADSVATVLARYVTAMQATDLEQRLSALEERITPT